MSILKVEDLVKKFDGKTVVNNISFDIKEGEVFGLLGPNGAGKSTTINIINGLLRKDAGKVHIGEFNIDNNTREARMKIGYVPQDLAIYGELSAEDNLMFFGSLYGLSNKILKERLKEVIELVGLEGKEKQKAGTFSGGMKRRLNIACALMHKPELLIMDEPTVGIDPQSRNNILSSVNKLKREGMAVLYTTHYMEEAENLCDRIAIIDNGVIIAKGTKEELVNYITDSNFAVFEINKVGDIDKEIFSEIKGIKNVELDPGILKFETDKNIRIMKDILDLLYEKNIEVKNMRTENPSLEQVFLSLTGKKLRD